MYCNLESRLHKLSLIPEKCENEEEIRNLACEILSFASEDERPEALLQCRNKLRKLQNEKCRKAESCQMCILDIGKLLESITLCADVLLSDVSKTLNYTFERQTIGCCPSLIIDAFLNLISNSAKFSNGGNIVISAFSKGDSEFIIVENSGYMDCSCMKSDGGIAAAAKAAKLHGGRLLYSSSGKNVKAGISLSNKIEAKRKYEVPAFSHFLSDEFSPVYIGLSDICVK